MAHPNPPPVPSPAFSQESEVVLNGGELSKGFIAPKKEKEAPFFRRRSRSQSNSISEQLKSNSNSTSASPPAVGILVGSRENIEQWLRESGPGSSCLWAEADALSQNAWGKLVSRQLKLIYRLHSEKSFTFLPVLNGTVVEISPSLGLPWDGGGLRKAQRSKKSVKGSGFMVEPEIPSPTNVSSNSTGDVSPSIDISVGLVENEKAVRLVIPEKAYRRLVLMVSPGGIIREFQDLLRRSLGSPSFLDVDFQLLDHQKWLKHHSLAAFLEGSDMLLLRRGDGHSGVRWVVLRFDFGEGVLKSTTSEDLDNLELVFGNKGISQGFGVRVSWWGQSAISSGDKAQEKNLGRSTNHLDWKIWTVPVGNGDFRGGPLTQLLLDALGREDRLSVAEMNSLKSLFGSPAQVDSPSQAALTDIETVVAFEKSKGMSWKEQCALSHLRSSSEELKGRGLHVLLNLLLVLGSKTSPTMKGLCPGSLHSNPDTSCGASCILEEETRQGVMQEDDSQAKHGVEPLHVMDWLNCGFLDVLLERTIVKGGDRKGEGKETGGVANVEVALEACLRVLELVPKEGSSQLAKLLVASVQEACEDFMKLNINLKHNGDCEVNCRKTAQPNTKHRSTNLRDMFEKLLRFCKLLSLLTSQSPLVGGPFAESGGLNLIFDLYFCLVKRFPTNLRFGVLANASGVCKSMEQILPGETLKSQDTSLKVLPCILTRACISRVAQACLMDHCMSPKTEKVDFAWPPTSDWKVLHPFKDLRIDSHFNANERSHCAFPFDSPPKGKLRPTCDVDLIPGVPKDVESCKPHQSTQTRFIPELSSSCSNSSGIPSTAGKGCPFPHAINQNTADNSQVKGTAIFHKPNKSRPFVPRLPLSSLRRSTSRFGPSMAESQEARALHTPSVQPNLSQVSSNTGPSTSQFEILTAVYNVKFELLQTMIWLFSNSSRSLCLSRSKLLNRFQKEDEDYLALQFLPDIISSFFKTVPESISKRTKEMLFEVISLLERGKVSDPINTTPSLPKGGMDAAVVMPCKVGQSLPFSGPRRLVDSLLLDIGERLRTLLCHLANLLATSQNSKEEAASDGKQTWVTMGASQYCDPLLENRTISSGHLLNLWVDIGLLLRALVDFAVLWPEGGSMQCVLNSCGKELETVLGLLAKYSSKRNWSLAQILTMENLLKLLTVCMKSSVLEKGIEFQIWSETDTFFWKLLFVNDLHWNCVKNFTTWVLMRSCQGCFRKLFEGYQKVLWEPLEVYYSMLGEQINPTTEALECTLHGVDMLRSIYSFLRVSILMMKKRLKCQSQITLSCPALFMERLLFLLDFLMNPVEGILMNVIRSPVPCTKASNTKRETEAVNLLESAGESRLNSTCEHTLPAIGDNLYSINMQVSCRKCPSTPCAASCAHKFLSYLKKESLGILADIFSLKSFDHHDEVAGLCVDARWQNPFLFRKYVNPFLEIIFFYFLKYYNKRIESSESLAISPLTQRISGHSTISVNSSQRYTLTRDGSSTHDTSLTRNDEDEVFCSGCSQDDKVSSVACVSYGQVLRVLSQNQTQDVNQSFQQMRVMKFLVQQIGLEYEISQVATPRSIPLPVGGITTEISLQEPQDCDCQGDKAGTSIAGLLWTGERSKAALPHESEDIDLLKVVVDESVRQRHKMKAAIIGAPGKVEFARESVVSALLLSKESPTSLRNSLGSRTSLDRARLCTHELVVGHSLYNHHHNLGFFFTRDASSAVGRRLCHVASFVKLLCPDSKGILLHVQKDAVAPLGQENDVNMFKKCNLTELEICSTQAASWRESGVLYKSNRTSGESKENILRSSITRGELHTGHDGTAGSNDLGKISDLFAVSRTGDAQIKIHQVQHSGERGGINTGATLTEVKYTGRFFDLNEEVEKELAQEGFLEAQHFPQEIDQTGQTSHFDVLDDIQEESTLQDFGSKVASFHPKKSRNGAFNKSSHLELFLELVPDTTSKRKPTHPAIPRLNLSKSVRKGGPAIKSDTSTGFEFPPSTTSTLDSKYRPNEMLELQRELQKEVVSSDRGSKSWEIGGSYETGCLQRRLYRHSGLHVLLLELFVSLMLTPQLLSHPWLVGTLETSYSDRYPMENRKLNAPFFLSYHLNHAANVYLLPCLSKRMKDFKPAAFRILKLTWRALFNPRIYTNKVHIARGAASQVYTAKVKQNFSKLEGATEELVVLKVVDVPQGPYDPCKFFDVYSEVEILEKFSGEPAICQILDYGVDMESFILVLKHYKCSLHTWRQGHRVNSGSEIFSPTEIQKVGTAPKFILERLPLYLEVYSAILQAVKKLEIENVVHYDLKCDNILLEPLDYVCLESEFWSPRWPPADPSKPLPFRICIADFGQSKASTHLGGECTVRNRGTEYVKSPEMLKLLSSKSQRDSDFNLRTTDEGVGKAVDVWSLGCLLYELLTGEYLFYDEDWLQFFMRVTLPSEELISKDKAAKLGNYGPVVDLLKFILVRDPLQRPSLDEVTICVEQLQLKLEAQSLTTTGDRYEVLTRVQILSEDGSDSEASDLDEQISYRRDNVLDRFEQQRHVVEHNILDRSKPNTPVMECLASLKEIMCHCQCRGE